MTTLTEPQSVFDRIIRREIPADIVYEDEDVLAVRDVNPQAPIHILVIPKRKLVCFSDLENADPVMVAKLFQAAATVVRLEGLTRSGYRVVSNCGVEGGQDVPYLHLHILGGRQMRWPPG